MLNRMLGAIRLDANTFEDVEDDRSATWQALAIVVIAAICFGVAAMIAEGEVNVLSVITLSVIVVIAWAVWALVTWLVGGFLLKTPETVADWGQLARGTGFAWSPGVFLLLTFLREPFGGIVMALTLIWVFACMVIAVRQCLDFTSTWRAFFVILISVIPALILLGITLAVVDIGVGVGQWAVSS